MPSEPAVGQILVGPLFSEPMQVVTCAAQGDGWAVGLVGARTQRFRPVQLTSSDLEQLSIVSELTTYDGDAALLRLGIQAYALGIAYEFDPYFALSVSRVDPLPHQLVAVYDYLLKLPRVRFLLADDAGAGKTIMAGLLIRELELRGLADRILIVCPSNLTFQWQRELREKFDEKFVVFKGADIREQYGVNQWLDRSHLITSLDLAKREEILPGLRQAHWDLVIVDEAHRMSARDDSHKSQRYQLGELLRDSTDHFLLLTATPHRGDPVNFTLFLQLLDRDAYADVTSVKQALNQRSAPFYLRRTKEAMVHFPEQQEDGTWEARKIFTKRIPHTAGFNIEGDEFQLYRDVTDFVKENSRQAASQENDPRARAVGFLMALFQRRLASSTYALRRSLEKRALRLESALTDAQALASQRPPRLPTADELDEMEDTEREEMEAMLAAITMAQNPEQVREEVSELRRLAEQAMRLENSGEEAKLSKLKSLLESEGFYKDRSQQLLIFTEFKDTLDYLMLKLRAWGFSVGCIHGGMIPGSRDQANTRLWAEQQFRDREFQILVATEAAGEGINLQCCNIMFNYDIPWNPNRMEQRMGRIHRYGQARDCLFFNYVAINTIEGHILQRLLEKLQEIRNALDDDGVFNVVGEVLPAAHLERTMRDFYAGKLGEEDLEMRVMKDVDEKHFRDICQNALEGLATKKFNLDMLVERRARAQERRVVPEAIARFLGESAKFCDLPFRPLANLPHSFELGRVPNSVKRHERDPDWKAEAIASKYGRSTTDRDIADKHSYEWITPGHPLFEAVRREVYDLARDTFKKGACFYSIQHESPARVDVYKARVVDGMSDVIHERLFLVEVPSVGEPRLREPAYLGDLQLVEGQVQVPPDTLADTENWLTEHSLRPFLAEVRAERTAEIERVRAHVELSLTELLHKVDDEIGRAQMAVDAGEQGAEGRLAMAEQRHAELNDRRARRREEIARQASLTLQGVERLTSILILPHPERMSPEVRNMQPDLETERISMQVVMEYEAAQGRKPFDVSEKNLGYDITSLDTTSGELRLIEVKGIKEDRGQILLSPNEHRVAQDRRDCYWLYVVTNCGATPKLDTVLDPAKYEWHGVVKVQHYSLSVNAVTNRLELREDQTPYGKRGDERAHS